MKRRDFLKSSIVASGLTALGALRAAEEPASKSQSAGLPLAVSTWPFGKAANEAAMKILTEKGNILDAIEHGLWVPESDPSNASVGLGGKPNAAGVVQLDAAIMSGPGHRAGAVSALEGIRHPISVARRVMEKTSHVMLAGEGARIFALQEGFESVPTNSEEKNKAWQKLSPAERNSATRSARHHEGHDTLTLLVLGQSGDMAAGCSTSGVARKLPGRVGDAPIVGSGLYVDNEVGAAGATGLGENIMRYCASFMVVELMRQGLHPEEACLETIRRIGQKEPKGTDLKINLVALNKKGEYGAAGTHPGFPFSVTTLSSSRILTGRKIA